MDRTSAGISSQLLVIFREYVADTWIKAEHLLCRLKHNKERSLLLVYPDFVRNEWYTLSVDSDVTKKFLYSVEILSESLHDAEQVEETEDKVDRQTTLNDNDCFEIEY